MTPDPADVAAVQQVLRCDADEAARRCRQLEVERALDALYRDPFEGENFDVND